MNYMDVNNLNNVSYDEVLTLVAGGCILIPQWNGSRCFSSTVGAPYNVWGLSSNSVNAATGNGQVRMIMDN